MQSTGDLVTALDILETSPLIGRSVGVGLRELVIGRGTRGSVALYRFLADVDVAFVLAIRHRREAGRAT